MLQLFDFKEYYNNISAWLSDRGLAVLSPEELPATGYVYSIDGIPTAAGFLRMIEGNRASIDCLISNPHQSAKDRNEAVDSISKSLILLAKSLSIQCIYAHTVEDSIATRAKELGFIETKQRVLTLSA